MKFRKEYDSIGSINVPVDKYWGASTERSKKYFNIGDVLVGSKLIKSIAIPTESLRLKLIASKDLPLNPFGGRLRVLNMYRVVFYNPRTYRRCIDEESGVSTVGCLKGANI